MSKGPIILSLPKDLSLSKGPIILSLPKDLSLSKGPIVAYLGFDKLSPNGGEPFTLSLSKGPREPPCCPKVTNN
ncbi:MAG: hypothetical protein KA766_20055 [Piscinibacter sp.]|uniref:hypothetical protein n=1 Tax=Piscinibacter sp. TaxID=1903157 RepID=UPI001B73E508|nr:hypothetical protein [Piscinibacter sp.]MBP5992298.1 hypothetical protein [Piscinibacter sp.]MBP6029349.1 hypothetical protein [Piscinibacter sp.]